MRRRNSSVIISLTIIRSRQGEPRDDIMSRLVHAEEQGDTLTEAGNVEHAEIIADCRE